MIDCGGSDPLVLGISILVYCTDLSGAKEGYYFYKPPSQCLTLDPTPVNPWLHNIYLSHEM